MVNTHPFVLNDPELCEGKLKFESKYKNLATHKHQKRKQYKKRAQILGSFTFYRNNISFLIIALFIPTVDGDLAIWLGFFN